MHDSKFQLFKAASAMYAAYSKQWGDVHMNAGFNKEKWNTLVQERLWEPEEARIAADQLDLLTSAALNKAGLGAIQLPAEYVAFLIAHFVDGRNWASASHFGRMYYNGAQALHEGSFDAREDVRPDYLLLLVGQCWDNMSAKRNGPQELADAQIEEVESANAKESKK